MIEALLVFVLAIGLGWPLGLYLARVMRGDASRLDALFGPFERLVYRVLGIDPKNVRVNGGVYNITDRKYWDYLSSRNIETATNQDANDRALAVMPGRTWQLGVNVDF